jgi:hypothetical protein
MAQDYLDLVEEKEENKVKPEDIFKPSKKELELVSKIYSKYVNWASVVNSPLEQFRGLNLENYLKISRQLFWSKASLKSVLQEDVFKAEFDLFLPEIRNNVLDIVAHLAGLRIKPVFGLLRKKLESIYQSKVLEAIYENWRNFSNDRIEKFWDYLYVTINGTLIKYIGWNETDKELVYFRVKKGKLSPQKERVYKGEVEGTRVPLENVFVPKIWEPDIQKQKEIIVVERMSQEEFREKYGFYEKSKYVYPGSMIAKESLYFQLLPSVSKANFFEVVRYYNSCLDQFVLLANGVWLNPFDEDENIFPIPFNHKQLPFAKTIFEPIDDRFFYGLSLPFKLKTPQEIYNVMNQLLILREMKEISPPILTHDFEKPKLKFGPSAIIPVGDINAYRELNISPASGSFFQSLYLIKSNLQPQSPPLPITSRMPRSATEKQIESYRRAQFLGNYVLMIWDLIRQESELVLKTALQFYPLSKFKEILPSGVMKEIYRLIQIENTPLPSGGIGDLELRITDNVSYWQELALEVASRRKFSKKPMDIIEITPEELQKIDFVIKDIQLETENPPALEQALFKEKIAFILQLFGSMVSPEKAVLRTMEILRESPADWLKEDILSKVLEAEEGGLLLNIPPATNLAQTGNLLQALRGEQFGALAQTKGVEGIVPFGSQENVPLNELMGGE